MPSDPDPRSAALGLSPVDVVRHGPAIRALLRAMVGEQDVDDLLQDTWVRALATESVRRGPLRPWLARIATNLVRDRRRRAGRVAPVPGSVDGDAAPAAAEVVAQLESWRELGAAVEALAEPYRTTIVLRFFRGMACAAVAEQMKTSEANVRQRIRRGVAQLRERLDGAGRERLVALLPALGVGEPEPAAVGTAAAVAAGALLVLGVVCRG